VSSRGKIKWLGEDVVLAIHEAQIAEHGGATGLRDRRLLESALARPKNAADYAKADPPTLGALYALGIIRNHPFVDGNKRVGAVLLDVFLEDHDHVLDVEDAELLQVIRAVAASTMTDDDFISWVRRHAHAAASS